MRSVRPPCLFRRGSAAAALLGAALAFGGCGGAAARPAAAPPESAESPAGGGGGSARAAGPIVLSRAAVRDVVARGLGAFLQRVDLDPRPVRAGGRFVGFRIVALRGDDFWRGVDLRAGDVVTRVDGLPIERPEQAQTAFESVGVASELRVSYERDGEPREIVFPIVDR